jgi:hypothetical protein
VQYTVSKPEKPNPGEGNMSKSVSHSEDDLVFLDETVTPSDNNTQSANKEVWRVMIIDDDADVHSATTFALSNV